ncbi:MAG: ATP-binding protein, partial [Agathobacter sp.]|nr:ATP-binding protein [Agathobacter sp.]
MESFIYYGLIYFVEALIIWQYGVQMFPSKYSKSTELLWSILLYTIPFALSLVENIWLNIFSFIVINFVYILVIFKTAWHIALFHSAIVTAIMGITEILCSTFFTQFTYAFFEDALLPQNLILLAMVTKLTYHLALQIIASLFSIKNKTLSFLNLESSILILIPFVSMIVMITFASICLSTRVSTPLTLLIGACSILLLITNIVVFAIHNYTQEKSQKYVDLQLQLQKEYDLTEYYKLLIEQHESQSILIHDIQKHLNTINLLNKQNDTEKIGIYINQIIH